MGSHRESEQKNDRQPDSGFRGSLGLLMGEAVGSDAQADGSLRRGPADMEVEAGTGQQWGGVRMGLGPCVGGHEQVCTHPLACTRPHLTSAVLLNVSPPS